MMESEALQVRAPESHGNSAAGPPPAVHLTWSAVAGSGTTVAVSEGRATIAIRPAVSKRKVPVALMSSYEAGLFPVLEISSMV